MTGGRIVNHSWLNAWRNYPYIMEFMRHLKQEEQECVLTSWPVRTMSEYVIDEDSVREGGREVRGMKARLLMLADGRRQIPDIAESTCLSDEAVMNIYRELNDECLVYFSEF